MAGKFKFFVFGGLIGAGIALLFAPKTGEETRSLIADKAEELWGEGQSVYSQGWEKAKAEVANVQGTASKANDELRQKIESARTAIAEQVAKNAQAARDAINSQVPVAGEKINQAVDVVRGQIDNAASKLKTATADLASQDAVASSDAVASAEADAATGAADVAPAGADVAADAVATVVPGSEAVTDSASQPASE